MDFNLSEEQQQFADALRRWIVRDYSFEQRHKIVHSEQGVSAQAWDTLVELGMTALPVPAAQGGFDGSAVDLMVVMQELGRGLVVEPYWSTVLGAEFLKRAGGHDALLEKIAAGTQRLACALGEKQARYDLFDITTSVTAEAGGYRINGMKTVVLHGAQADTLIVSARSAGATRDLDGISLSCWRPITPAYRVAITVPSMASAPPIFRSTMCSCRPRRCWARAGLAGRCWTRYPTMALHCCAPKRLA